MFSPRKVQALLVVLLPSLSAARTLWVSSLGLDSNPCTGSSRCRTVPHAVSRAADGDIVMIDSGEFDPGSLNITADIQLVGLGQAQTILACGSPDHGLSVHSARFSLQSLTLTRCGRGLDLRSGAITVRSVSFQRLGSPYLSRAAVHVAASVRLSVNGSSFSLNQCGALRTAIGSTVVLESSQFRANFFNLSAPVDMTVFENSCGATAVLMDGGNLSCTDCLFTENTGPRQFETVMVSGGAQATLLRSNFSHNSAQQSGSLTVSCDARFTMKHSALYNNSIVRNSTMASIAFTSGQALDLASVVNDFGVMVLRCSADPLMLASYKPRGQQLIQHCTFRHNPDAVVVSKAARPLFEDCLFEHSQLALHFALLSKPVVRRTRILDNAATGTLTARGVNMYDRTAAVTVVQSSEALFEACLFQNNSRAISVSEVSVLEVSDSVFRGNRADDAHGGGAIWVDLKSIVRVGGCVFDGNIAYDAVASVGGAIGISGQSGLYMNYTNFTNNIAAVGGAINVEQSSVNMTGCHLTENLGLNGFSRASREIGAGGAMNFAGRAAAYLTDCHFRANYAGFGGALFINARAAPIISKCSFDSNAAQIGGSVHMTFVGTSPQFTLCNFTNNTATGKASDGGAVSIGTGASPSFWNCSFVENLSQAPFGHAVYSSSAHPSFYFNTARSRRAFSEETDTGDFHVDYTLDVVHMQGNQIDSLYIGAHGNVSLTAASSTFTATGLTNQLCQHSEQFKSVGTYLPQNPFCLERSLQLCQDCAPNAFMVRLHEAPCLDGLYSLHLRHLRAGGEGFTVGTTLIDSRDQLALEAVHQQLAYCSPGDARGQFVHCTYAWNAGFYLLVVLLALPAGVLLVYAGRRYYLYLRDWKVRPVVRGPEAQQPLLGGMEDLYVALDEASELEGAEAPDGLFTAFGYGVIDFKRELWMHQELGRGQYGSVRRATLRRRNRMPAQYVAVKALLRGDPSELVEEAKQMLDIPPHPNVVRFLGVCEEPACMVTAMVEAANELHKHLRHVHQCDGATAHAVAGLDLLTDTAAGLGHLHEHRLIHRDLAARNVLVDGAGRAMVNDFGLSRKIPLDAQEQLHEMDMDRIYYRLAPENYDCLGRQYHSFASDVFMFGATLWECLANLWPADFEGGGGLWRHFTEGKGLRSLDSQQVTKPASPRQGEPPRAGLRFLGEELEAAGMTGSVIERTLKLVAGCLQHEEGDRPAMKQVCYALLEIREQLVRAGLRSSGSHQLFLGLSQSGSGNALTESKLGQLSGVVKI